MFSVDWVEDCIDAQQLIEHDTLTYRLGTASWNKRRHFSRDDDMLLQEFVKSKKAQNAYLNGNKIYEELAGQVRPLISCLEMKQRVWMTRPQN